MAESAASGRGDGAVLGGILLMVGCGLCVLASVQWVHRDVVSLPLGPAEATVEDPAYGRNGLILGLVLVFVGVVVLSLSNLRNRDETSSTSDEGADAWSGEEGASGPPR